MKSTSQNHIFYSSEDLKELIQTLAFLQLDLSLHLMIFGDPYFFYSS